MRFILAMGVILALIITGPPLADSPANASDYILKNDSQSQQQQHQRRDHQRQQSAFPQHSQTIKHYAANGATVGRSVVTKQSARHYSANGNFAGQSRLIGNTVHEYSANGKLIGKSSPSFRQRE